MPYNPPLATGSDLEKNGRKTKYIILGSHKVGKTSIFMRNVYHSLDLANRGGEKIDEKVMYASSAAAFVFNRQYSSLWDMSHREGFLENMQEYYHDADVALLVFDVTRRDTFQEVQAWATEIKDKIPKIIVVANMIDLLDREVPQSESIDWATKEDLIYHETSSKLNIGIQELIYNTEHKNLKNFGLQDLQPYRKIDHNQE